MPSSKLERPSGSARIGCCSSLLCNKFEQVKIASGGRCSSMACGSRPPNASGLQRIRSINARLRRTWFKATSQPRLWTGDITSIWTAEGWLYLAVVLDVFSRRIVGWSMKNRMTDELTITAFKNALIRRRPAPGLIFHSDQGSQQCSNRFQSLLKGTGGLQSMSGVGCCSGNCHRVVFRNSEAGAGASRLLQVPR